MLSRAEANAQWLGGISQVRIPINTLRLRLAGSRFEGGVCGGESKYSWEQQVDRAAGLAKEQIEGPPKPAMLSLRRAGGKQADAGTPSPLGNPLHSQAVLGLQSQHILSP